MPDPGYSYLYNKSPKRSPSASAGPYQPGGGGGSGAGSPARSGSHSRLQHGSHAPTAAPSEPGHLAANGQLGKWEAALGNIEDARVTLDTCVASPASLQRQITTRLPHIRPANSMQLWNLSVHERVRLYDFQRGKSDPDPLQ